MDVWIITEIGTGNTAEVSGNDVERLVGVELSYIVWTISQDGWFKNGKWKVEATVTDQMT